MSDRNANDNSFKQSTTTFKIILLNIKKKIRIHMTLHSVKGMEIPVI
jgi:hypothetical protein